MKNKKVYIVIESFTKLEENRCRKFIVSPYFNKNDGIIKLFEVALEQKKVADFQDFSEEEIWQKLEPTKPFNPVRLRKYFSDLLKLIERFIAQEEYERKPIHKASLLLHGINNRKLEKLYAGSIRTAEKLSTEQKKQSIDGYFYNYRIEQQINTLTKGHDVFLDYNLDKISLNLDIYYLIEKLKLYCDLLSLKLQKNTEKDFFLMEPIINHVETHDYGHVPQLMIYYHMMRALKEQDNTQHYEKLRRLLEKHGGEFDPQDATLMYNFAINYIVVKINSGYPEFLSEYFELYKDLLNKRLIFENGLLPASHFFNVITTALRLKEYTWTEGFIEEYKVYLNEKEQENVVAYAKAQFSFYQKDFPKVLEILRFVELNDLGRKLNSKVMLITTYFELREFEALHSLTESFRTFLSRNTQLQKNKKALYLNLIKFVKKFIQIPDSDKAALLVLRQKVEQSGATANSAWLLEKINSALNN